MRVRFVGNLPVLVLAACVTPGLRSLTGTGPDISPSDVEHRMLIVANDSMLGREAGAEGNYKVTEYLAREAARMGLEPAGDNGSYFQVVPMVMRRPNPSSLLVAGSDTLTLIRHFAPIRPTSTARVGTRISVRGLSAIFGGRAGDTTLVLDEQLVKGRLVVFDAPTNGAGQRSAIYAAAAGTEAAKYPGAAGIAIAALDLQNNPADFQRPRSGLSESAAPSAAPGGILISDSAALQLLGAEMSRLKPGTAGRTVVADVSFLESPVKYAARNVIAVRKGSHPVLKHEYVAVGAHSDHLGVAAAPVEHDSLRAFNRVMRPEGVQTRLRTPTPEEWQSIFRIRDSLRKIRPPRLDSIFNGADDDGSGTVALLEVAEKAASQPRHSRSILFVWHTAEESGLLGSMYFVDHPTVPKSAIVAQVNMDMVGRGRETDTPSGGPLNLQAIGMRRLSTELGNIVDSVNRARTVPWKIDLTYDAPGHPLLRYCRSDHQNYARQGIPIVYFSRGYHQDYHVATDEAEYIDIPSLSRVAGFVHDVAAAIADRRQRPVVDKSLPNLRAPCRQ